MQKEVAETALTLLAEEDCYISLALAANFRGSEIIFSHQVGPYVQGQVIKEESFEQEIIIFVKPVVQRDQAAHLPNQG